MRIYDDKEWNTELRQYPLTTVFLILLGTCSAIIPIFNFFLWETKFRLLFLLGSILFWVCLLFVTLFSRQIESKDQMPDRLKIVALNIIITFFILLPITSMTILIASGYSIPLAAPILIITISPGGAYVAHKIKKSM